MTVLQHVDVDLVACFCGHLRDEHETGLFAACAVTGCGCDDYAVDTDDAFVQAAAAGQLFTSTLLSIDDAQQLVGEPASTWHGRCYEIATKLHARAGDTFTPGGGRVVYGHYRGFVHPDGFFEAKAKHGFVQHGWIDLGDGTVVDPTRWVFENVDPYLYQGPGEEYDDGGNELRAQQTRPCPVPDPAGRKTVVPLPRAAAAWLLAASGGVLTPTGPTDATEVPVVLDTGQLFWLANLALPVFGEYARDVYAALVEAGFAGLLPIDNRLKVLGS